MERDDVRLLASSSSTLKPASRPSRRLSGRCRDRAAMIREAERPARAAATRRPMLPKPSRLASDHCETALDRVQPARAVPRPGTSGPDANEPIHLGEPSGSTARISASVWLATSSTNVSGHVGEQHPRARWRRRRRCRRSRRRAAGGSAPWASRRSRAHPSTLPPEISTSASAASALSLPLASCIGANTISSPADSSTVRDSLAQDGFPALATTTRSVPSQPSRQR